MKKSETKKATQKPDETAGSEVKRKVFANGLPFETEHQAIGEGHLNAIIYGLLGSGKTTLAAEAEEYEETSPALLVDFEKGTRSIEGSSIEITRPQSFKEIQTIYDFLLHDNNKFRSVILDPLTELQRRHSMGEILGDFKIVTGNEEYGYADLGISVVATRQDWLKTGEQMRKFIRAFRDLAYLREKERRVHVMMTALEKYNEKRMLVAPQLSGALGEECGAMVDLLLRLSKQNVNTAAEGEEEVIVTKRHLLIDEYTDAEGTKFMAKGRGKDMPRGLWEPTMAEIFRIWKGGKA